MKRVRHSKQIDYICASMLGKHHKESNEKCCESRIEKTSVPSLKLPSIQRRNNWIFFSQAPRLALLRTEQGVSSFSSGNFWMKSNILWLYLIIQCLGIFSCSGFPSSGSGYSDHISQENSIRGRMWFMLEVPIPVFSIDWKNSVVQGGFLIP